MTRLAILCLAASAALTSWALARALDPRPVAPAPAGTVALGVPLLDPVTVPAGVVQAALDADPFTANRRRPGARYRLPGDAVARTAPTVAPPVVLGTVLAAGGGSFALCQMGSSPPVVVRVGESIGGFTLRSVDKGRAVFLSPQGRELVVNALTPRTP
jgi:hypothetical protein